MCLGVTLLSVYAGPGTKFIAAQAVPHHHLQSHPTVGGGGRVELLFLTEEPL